MTGRLFSRFLAPALALVFGLNAVPARAATGDLVVVCLNSDVLDANFNAINGDFALIALANLPAGARYFITDSGWSTNTNNLMQEGSSPSPNRQIQFDVIKAGGIPLGTVIKFVQSGANVVLTDPTLATLTMVNRFNVTGSPLSTKLSFNTAGDQCLIYQTADNTATGVINMVSAFNGSNYTGNLPMTNGWNVGTLPLPFQTGASRESNLPGGLTAFDGTNFSTATALGLASFPVGGLTGQLFYKYVGSYALADKTAYMTAINNPVNWVANSATPYEGVPEVSIIEIINVLLRVTLREARDARNAFSAELPDGSQRP